jgi:hypothetical protein
MLDHSSLLVMVILVICLGVEKKILFGFTRRGGAEDLQVARVLRQAGEVSTTSFCPIAELNSRRAVTPSLLTALPVKGCSSSRPSFQCGGIPAARWCAPVALSQVAMYLVVAQLTRLGCGGGARRRLGPDRVFMFLFEGIQCKNQGPICTLSFL